MIGVLFLFSFAASRKFESIVNKYKEQLKGDHSVAKEEQAILWSLAELARQVDKSVTAEEVETEIGSKINEILERVEIADAVLRKDFNSMRQEFTATRDAVSSIVEGAKQQIINDMALFKAQLIDSLRELATTSGNAQEGWVKNSYQRVQDTFGNIKNTSLIRSVIFFVCFQVLLVLGLIFYKKLDNQLRINKHMNFCKIGFFTAEALESKWGTLAVVRDRSGNFYSAELLPDEQVFTESSDISSNVQLPSVSFIKSRQFAELQDGTFISIIDPKEIVQCSNLNVTLINHKFTYPEWTHIERHLSNFLRTQHVAFINGTIITVPIITKEVIQIELNSSLRQIKFFTLSPTTKINYIHSPYASNPIYYPSFTASLDKLTKYVTYSMFNSSTIPQPTLFGSNQKAKTTVNIHPKGCILCGSSNSGRSFLVKCLCDKLSLKYYEIDAENFSSSDVTFPILTRIPPPKTIVLLRNFDIHLLGNDTPFEKRLVAQLSNLIDSSTQVFYIMTTLSKDPIHSFLLSSKRLSFYMLLPPLSITDLKYIFNKNFSQRVIELTNGLTTEQILRLSQNDNTEVNFAINQSNNIIKGTIKQTNWEDIGGLSSTKQLIRESIEWPLIRSTELKEIGIKPPKGILLYGPPGCGKTMIARAIATTLSSSFFSISGASIYQMYLGESERIIRELFVLANQKKPSIIFIDEIDAMVGKRGNSTGVTERVLSTFLNEMDGITNLEDVIVIAATNRVEALDEALCRPGRFDILIEVKPTQNLMDIKDIFKVCTKNMPIENNELCDKVCELLKIGITGAEIDNLCREAALIALKQGDDKIGFEHFNVIISKYRK
ncbi:AAA family ATPase [Histomonas meleagridis]|uniref:AAA family ATPase n=1 Tax=Histomonas meleagridis TaxID=135588 RepID=UPI003559429E|nr:AAA family ATPase [Histomonas meleagridis]KAH0798466.1 AAA family ATPase [Histomonas meleagridis]